MEPCRLYCASRGNAVLVSEDDWCAVQETLYRLSVPGMRESIREGMARPVDDLERVSLTVATWSVVHGLAQLLIDGATLATPDADAEDALIDRALAVHGRVFR